MADHYCDTAATSGANDGSSPSDAWQTIKAAMESTITDGDTVWYRRGISETPTADITAFDVAIGEPTNKHIGWPRGTDSITSSDWTNGSNLVDNVVGITISRETYLGRFITAPDGHRYLITAILYEVSMDGIASGDEFTTESELTNVTKSVCGKVWNCSGTTTTDTLQYTRGGGVAWENNDNLTDADGGDGEINSSESAVGLIIDREYAGATVTGGNGTATIQADEDYDDRPAAGISAGWDADTDALPEIDFNGGSYQIYMVSDSSIRISGFDIKGTIDPTGAMRVNSCYNIKISGCLFYGSNNGPLVRTDSTEMFVERSIFQGERNSGTSSFLFYTAGGGSMTTFRDVSVYGAGRWGLFLVSYNELYNVNVGVEIGNEQDDITPAYACKIIGRDVQLGANYKAINAAKIYCHFENYQKVLGTHASLMRSALNTWEKLEVVIGSGDPEKRVGGSDTVVDVVNSENSTAGNMNNRETIHPVISHNIETDTTSKSYRYYIQSADALTADEIYLRCIYVDSNDGTKYTRTEVFSDETISARSSASDWSQYIEVTNIQPVVDSNVILELYYVRKDTTHVYIDPMVVII